MESSQICESCCHYATQRTQNVLSGLVSHCDSAENREMKKKPCHFHKLEILPDARRSPSIERRMYVQISAVLFFNSTKVRKQEKF